MGPFDEMTVVCPLCGGLGVLVMHHPVGLCDACHGTGWVPINERQPPAPAHRSGTQQQVPPQLVACPFCQRTGQMLGTDYEPCVMCQGTGRIPA